MRNVIPTVDSRNMTPIYVEPETERIIVMAFITVLVHLFVLFGISFIPTPPSKLLNSTMDVILVQKSTEEEPQDPKYLAQVSQEGGGESTQDARPATPVIAPFPDQTADVVATPAPPQEAIAPQVPEVTQLTTDRRSTHSVEPENIVVAPDESTPASDGETNEEVEAEDEVPTSTLIANARARLASVQAEFDERFEAQAKSKKRVKFVSASTKESKYATYINDWLRKAERVGTLNFPAEASRKRISGKLILDVAINSDGTIYEVSINKSSGHSFLDAAALRIVHLAAPFSPFPDNIRRETDIIYMTRTWEFLYGKSNSLTVR